MHESIKVIINVNYVIRPFCPKYWWQLIFCTTLGEQISLRWEIYFTKKYRLHRYSLV